jgi:Zn-dependent protease
VEKVIVFALGAGAMIESDRILFDRRAGLKVALAGPLGSFTLATIGGILWLLLPNIITVYFCLINIAFGVFNLLPMFPSDGGRILYSLLSYKFDFAKSAKIAVITSYVVCFFGALVSFYFNLWFMFGLFIFLVFFAWQQYQGFKRALYK